MQLYSVSGSFTGGSRSRAARSQSSPSRRQGVIRGALPTMNLPIATAVTALSVFAVEAAEYSGAAAPSATGQSIPIVAAILSVAAALRPLLKDIREERRLDREVKEREIQAFARLEAKLDALLELRQ